MTPATAAPCQDPSTAQSGPVSRTGEQGRATAEGTRATPEQMNSARAAKRARDLAWQEASREWIGDYFVQVAIGKTGGVDNVGWEIHPPAHGGRVWFQMTREEAIARIPAHRAYFAKNPNTSEDGNNA